MKKILLSAYACIPNQGSEEATGWLYATNLSQRNLEVHCLTQHKGEATITPVLASGLHLNLHFHYVTVPEWVDKAYFKGLVGMYFHYIYWQWAASQLARQLDKTHQFDLVHHITYGSIQLGSFMYRLRKPFIFGPVSGGQHAPPAMKQYFGKFWRREQMRTWVGQVLQLVNPGFYKTQRLANRVIVTNKDTYDLARRYRPELLPVERVLDGGIGASFMPETPVEHQPGDVLKLLWVGRMLPRKALELTIQALAKVDPSIPLVLTIVGGKGDLVDEVPRYIEENGVADRINWVGHVTHEEVKQFFRESDVFFFTSLRDSGPHQLLEAMAYSLPIVTINIHGQAETVSDKTGIRVPVTTPEEVTTGLARAVEWMAAHPTERQAMGRAAHAFALTQLWEQKVNLFVNEWYPAALKLTREKFLSEPVAVDKEPIGNGRLTGSH